MKNKKLVIGLIALAIAVSLVNIAFTVKDSYFDNIEYLPEGEFLYSSLSAVYFALSAFAELKFASASA